jgi:hypothetical protein
MNHQSYYRRMATLSKAQVAYDYETPEWPEEQDDYEEEE